MTDNPGREGVLVGFLTVMAMATCVCFGKVFPRYAWHWFFVMTVIIPLMLIIWMGWKR